MEIIDNKIKRKENVLKYTNHSKRKQKLVKEIKHLKEHRKIKFDIEKRLNSIYGKFVE